MALYHKWGVKTGFTVALQFFMLISDGLGGVTTKQHIQYTENILFSKNKLSYYNSSNAFSVNR